MSRLFVVLAAFAALTITSCKKDKFDEPNSNTTDPNIANATIADLRALFTSGNPITITNDIIVGGIVTADDKTGNFYKQIVIQDSTGAIPVLINKSGLNADYPVGRKVYIKCKGLVLGQYGKNLQLGGYIDYTNANGEPSVGNIPSATTDLYVIKGPYLTPLAPKSIARLSDLNFTTDQSILIKLDPVEFLDGGVVYADVPGEQSLSRTLKDCYGDLMDVRTSNHASFANQLTPSTGTKVSIIGIYSVFNGTKQLSIRSISEVQTSLTPCGPDPSLPTITIAALRAMFPTSTSGNYPAGASPIVITTDANITGIVTANDHSGNFYKQIVIQDATGAIPILINDKDLYKQFEIGRRIYVRIRGTVLGQYGKNLQLGNYIDSTSATWAVGSIYADYVPNYILKGAMETPIVPRRVSSIADLNLNTDQSTLIELNPVSFSIPNRPFADVNNGTSTSWAITDCDGGTLDVRTSNFADFARQNTPTGRVSMVGIYSVYGTSATLSPKPQFAIREYSEVQTSTLRCPYVLNEDFESIASTGNNTTLNIPGWKNITQTNTALWQAAVFSSVKCAKIDSYNATSGAIASWLISPMVNLDGFTTKELNFLFAPGRCDGVSSFKVLISSDYDGGNSPQNFTWTELSQTISTTPTGNVYGTLAPYPTISLSAYTGNIYIAFKYDAVKASTEQKTVYEIDNIKLLAQ